MYLVALLLFVVTRAHARGEYGYVRTPWDSGWYAIIAREGYTYNGDFTLQQTVAFSPLFPLMVRLVWWCTPTDLANALLLTSDLCTLGASLFLWRTLRQLLKRSTAMMVLGLTLLNPFSIYLFNGYSEAAWFLSITAFCYALFVRDSYPLAYLAVIAGSLARPYGIILAVPLFIEVLRRHLRTAGWAVWRPSREAFALWLAPLLCLGLIGHTLSLGIRFGDPLAGVHVLAAWTQPLRPDLVAFISMKNLFANLTELGGPTAPGRGLGAALVLSSPALLVIAARRLPGPLTAFSVVLLLFLYGQRYNDVSIVSSDLGRHTLVLFPLWVGLAMTLSAERERADVPAERVPPLYFVVLAFFAAGFVIFTERYFMGQWVS